jgi:hypothetical protein
MMAMTSTSKRIGFAGERMVEVEQRAAVAQFAQEAGEAGGAVGRAEFDQRVDPEFDLRRQGAARDTFDEARVVAAEGVRCRELEDVALAGGQSEQAAFERFGELAATHLQGRRRQVEGADVLGAVEVGEAVVQRQIAVGSDR